MKWKSIIKRVILYAVLIVLAALSVSALISHYLYEQYLTGLKQAIATTQQYNTPHKTFSAGDSNKPIGILVMSGGGSHGLAQLEVLQYLEEKVKNLFHHCLMRLGVPQQAV